MRTSILGTYFLATKEEHDKGMVWYQSARSEVDRICQTLLVNPARVAGVIAALSPNNKWNRNLIDAYNLARAYVENGVYDADRIKVSTFNTNKDKAIRILAGLDPLDVLGGLKVRAFYKLIFNPTVKDVVCIDGHSYSIWAGERIATYKTPKITPKMYDAIQRDYIDSARIVSEIKGQTITASQLQAITWIVQRNLYRGIRER
jgi:hypothetical protein